VDSSTLIVGVLLGLVALRFLLIALGAALIVRPVIDCPACFAPTFALYRRLLQRLVPWLEWRWCPHCGWQGPARRISDAARRRLERLPEQPEPHPFDGSGSPWS
jgi:hypothetical protein